MKRLAISLALLCCASTFGQIATDPYWQMVTLTNAGITPHGTGLITGSSGSNVFLITSRDNPYFIRVPVENISNLTYQVIPTNIHSGFPAWVAVSNKAYVYGTQPGSGRPNYSTITMVDPDNTAGWSDISISSNNTTGFLPNVIGGGITSDGTNLFVAGGYSIGKFNTAGVVLATNSFYQGSDQASRYIGQTCHALAWDGNNVYVTGNAYNDGPNTTFQQSLMVVNRADLSYTWINVCGTNFLTWQSALYLRFTDDIAVWGGWVFPGDEGSGSDSQFCFRVSDGYVVDINCGVPGSPSNFGNFWDGHYIWGTWNNGFLSRFDPKEITNGIVKVDLFTLGTNRYAMNELAFITNQTPNIIFATDFSSPAHVYRFSQPDYYGTVWSATNWVQIQPFILFRIQ